MSASEREIILSGSYTRASQLLDGLYARLRAQEQLLKRAADTLQEMEDGDYNNSLAMEIYKFLEEN